MEKVIVKFTIKRKLADQWYIFQGEVQLDGDDDISFDPEIVRAGAIEAIKESTGQYPEDELILTFEKP